MARSVNLIVVDNKVGLSSDMGIVREVLEHEGISVRVCDPYRDAPGPANANIFLEIPVPAYFREAPVQVFIPNPEWWQMEWTPWLRQPNVLVFAKTRHGEAVFRNLGARVCYLGFMSFDRQDPLIPKQRKFLHLAGKSASKGTDQVIQAWARNPDFPTVVIIQHPSIPRRVPHAGNIIFRSEYAPSEEVRRLQNECLFHLCPSQYEGFGHYIWEGLSCGAVVLTTGFPPMNEAVQPHFGILMPALLGGQHGAVRLYEVSSQAIEQAVRGVMSLTNEQLAARSRIARQVWEQNAREFRRRFVDLVRRL